MKYLELFCFTNGTIGLAEKSLPFFSTHNLKARANVLTDDVLHISAVYCLL